MHRPKRRRCSPCEADSPPTLDSYHLSAQAFRSLDAATSIPWGPIRSTLTEKFSFGDIKQLVGYGDLDMSRLAHLEQKQQNGASKSQLLSEIDKQVASMDERDRGTFASICCEEMLRRKPDVLGELERVLSRVGWQFSGSVLVPIEIFDMAELPQLPDVAATDIEKAASRLRDGDLSGALSAACGAVDAVTTDIYVQCGLGDPAKDSFQQRVKRSMDAVNLEVGIRAHLAGVGWQHQEQNMLVSNLIGSLNQAAYVMQKLRSDMGDVHGTKPVVAALVYDAIKWSSLLLRMLSPPKDK